jgi:hypothetical protein
LGGKGGKPKKNLATPNLLFALTGVARVARVANDIVISKYIFLLTSRMLFATLATLATPVRAKSELGVARFFLGLPPLPPQKSFSLL